MKRGDIVSYAEWCAIEGANYQRGMNFNIPGKDYAIILMSVRPNAPYHDEITDNGTTIIYEGHDVDKRFNVTGKSEKEIDQPMYFTPSKKLTQNGLFYKAAEDVKTNGATPKKVKVYEKIKPGIWSYNGYFYLIDAWMKKLEDSKREVFKFKLKLINEVIDDVIQKNTEVEFEHNRLIPRDVKIEVWKIDKGRCRNCGSKEHLHFDHIIPFSKGGSSISAENIQILCEKCNLEKHDSFKY